MPYETITQLPKGVKNNLPAHAQDIYLAAFNNAYGQYDQEENRARRVAWSAVKKAGYAKGESKWRKTRVR